MRVASLFAAFLTGTVFATFFALAWTGPTSPPPDGNVAAPINVGTTDQIKDGGLGLDALAVFGNSILSGPSVTYLNFGATAGESGYGIRDNSGTIEFKNSGGTWRSLLPSTGVTSITFADGTTQSTAASSSRITSCPTGWRLIGSAAADGSYCIEIAVRAATTFANAAYICGGLQPTGFGRAHLCSFNQWYTACRYGSGLSSMPANAEWIGDLSNTGAGAALTSGDSNSCDSFDGSEFSNLEKYRCCLL